MIYPLHLKRKSTLSAIATTLTLKKKYR